MVTVTITYAPNVEDKHRTIIGMAETILERVLNHGTFRAEVEGAQYSGGTLFKQKNGQVVRKTPSQVADIILNGIERDRPDDDDLDMTISPYPHPKGVVGSAGLGRQPIRPAIWFLEQCAKRGDAVSLARHLIHEWLHVAGFFHSRSGPGQDDVPYQVGDIVRKIAKTLPRQAGFLADEVTGLLDEDDLASYLLEEADDIVELPEDW